MIYNFLFTKHRKNLIRIIYEFLYLTIRDREIATYYFTAHAYLIGSDYKKFCSHKKALRNGIFDLNDKRDAYILDGKDSFNKWCQKNGIPTVREYSLIDFEKMDEEKKYFIKPKRSSQGRGCEVISYCEVLKYLKDEDFVVQELVKQHPVVKNFNPTSLNTMRVHTLKKGENIHIVSAYQRMGQYGSEVDNLSQGGLMSVVDLDKWVVKGYLLSHFKEGPKIYREHPRLYRNIEGTQLPYHEESKVLLERAASNTSVKFVGWDLAFTEDGPIIIEANTFPGLNSAQYSMGGFKNSDIFYESYSNLMGDCS